MDAITTNNNNVDDDQQSKFNSHHRSISIVFIVFVIIFFLLIIILIISYALLFHTIAKDSDQLDDYIRHYLRNWPSIIIQILTFMALSSACLLATFAVYLLRDQFKCRPLLNCNNCYEEQTTTTIINVDKNCDDTITRSSTKPIDERGTIAVSIDKQITIH
ncbi:uncharacterized protein LOC113797355 [Dermatophagoides pteronyssinus]|uniref:uncharacterized protein LOC113797355 n=1 Tax=Dermatophagoides pteronyssinus TaxID=6956 RepID=UPI003F679CD4